MAATIKSIHKYGKRFRIILDEDGEERYIGTRPYRDVDPIHVDEDLAEVMVEAKTKIDEMLQNNASEWIPSPPPPPPKQPVAPQ